jgi:hypothetical protein
MRVVGYFRPGLVQRARLGRRAARPVAARALPADPHRLLTVHDPAGCAGCSNELADRIRRVHTRVSSTVTRRCGMAERGAPGPSRGSWRCSSATGTPCEDEELRSSGAPRRARLRDLARARRRADDDRPRRWRPCGCTRYRRHGHASRRRHLDDRAVTSPWCPIRRCPAAVIGACQRRRDEHDAGAPGRHVRPAPAGAGDKPRGLASRRCCAPVGFADGTRRGAARRRLPARAVGGPSGSGKTNLLLTMIAR